MTFGAYNPQRFAGAGQIFGTLFFALINFIPFGLITFGPIADLIGQEFRYSIGSFVGFVSILLNFLLARSLGMGVDPTGSEASDVMAWCTIPGMENLESKLFPMNIVSSSAIMTYYLTFAATARSSGQNISIYIAFPVIFLLQLITFYLGGCDKYYKEGIGFKFGALLIGAIIGILGWVTIYKGLPEYSPFLAYGAGGGGATTSGYGSSRPPMAPGVGGAPPSGAKCSQDTSEAGDEFLFGVGITLL